jgi:hypothetical protein
VAHYRLSWLASNPPKQVVRFTLDGVPHRLVLTAEIPVRAGTLASPRNRPGP